MLGAFADPSLLPPSARACVEGPERRRRQRVRLQLSVRLQPGKDQGAIDSITRDISSDGFLCLTPRPFEKGEFLVCCIAWPSHGRTGQDKPFALRCNARVVRCEHDPETGFYRTAYRIEDYECNQLDPPSATVTT